MAKQKHVPKYRLYRPKSLGVVRLDGRDIYLGPYGTPASLERYHRLITEWLSGSHATFDAPPAPAQRTINELIFAFSKYVESYYCKDGRPTSEQACIRSALRHLRLSYGSLPAVDFGPLKLVSVRETMIRAGLCRTTVNQNVGRIKRLFAWAVANELIPPSVDQALRTVRGLTRGRSQAREPVPVRSVPQGDVLAVLPFLSPIVGAMVKFQLATGCRPSEVCQLRPADIDRSTDVWCYICLSHKTEHHGLERRVFIGPDAQAVLHPYLQGDPNRFCFSPKQSAEIQRQARSRRKRKKRKGTARARRKPGEHYTRDSYRRAVARACLAAKIPVWSPNRLRHSAGTLIRSRFGAEASRVVLGHRNLSTTEIYAEKDFDLARKVAAQLG